MVSKTYLNAFQTYFNASKCSPIHIGSVLQPNEVACGHYEQDFYGKFVFSAEIHEILKKKHQKLVPKFDRKKKSMGPIDIVVVTRSDPYFTIL